jgi:hypothetical protein
MRSGTSLARLGRADSAIFEWERRNPPPEMPEVQQASDLAVNNWIGATLEADGNFRHPKFPRDVGAPSLLNPVAGKQSGWTS